VGREIDDYYTLWRFIGQAGAIVGLSAFRALGWAGLPRSIDGYEWIYG